jgi:hypothetical protein
MNLEATLANHLGAQRIPIDQIDQSCCESRHSVFPIIDFDAVKIEFCSNRRLGLPTQLKSADCLHIDTSKRAICFVEMKNTQNWILSNAEKYLTTAEFMDAFDKWLKNKTKELKIKLIDSVFIIVAAAGMYSSGTNDVAQMLDKHDVQITYVVLTNMDNDEYLQYNIASLESKIRYPLLAGPSHSAVTVITEDCDSYIANKL